MKSLEICPRPCPQIPDNGTNAAFEPRLQREFRCAALEGVLGLHDRARERHDFLFIEVIDSLGLIGKVLPDHHLFGYKELIRAKLTAKTGKLSHVLDIGARERAVHRQLRDAASLAALLSQSDEIVGDGPQVSLTAQHADHLQIGAVETDLQRIESSESLQLLFC